MKPIFMPGIFVSLVCLCTSLTAQTRAKNDTVKALEAIRQKHELPALGVVVIQEGKIVEQAVVGVRKAGDSTPVTIQDHFHLGSCTKSMTATLAGMLIDEKKIRWDTTVVEALPELKGKIQQQYETVTLEQLLQNRSGLPTEPPAKAWERAWQEQGTVAEQRWDYITAALNEPPAAPAGTKMIYSNQGFTVAAVMLEKIEGKSWEESIQKRLFQPLRMKSAGFGFPGTKNKSDQPWGHLRENGKHSPVQTDNPPAVSPAGRVHCTLPDWARFVQLHLGAKEVPHLLQPATLARLHTPPRGEPYAAGWVVVDRPWAGGPALMHNGTNNMWYAVMWLAPNKRFAVLTATNIAGEPAEQACDQVAEAMIRKWLK
jgi:CubicO group peptidase (beta-lactamase class C family)